MSFLQVYVNQVYAGFARVQEEPKKPFLKARFGHDKGQLFKCDRGLIYQGGNRSDYEGEAQKCFLGEFFEMLQIELLILNRWDRTL